MELRNRDTGKWEPTHLYKTSSYRQNALDEVYAYDTRNYQLFGVLAGVRSMTEPIVEPRGIPNDVNTTILSEWDEECQWSHTPTWYTLYELRLAAKDKKRYTKDERVLLKDFIHHIEFVVDAYWFFDSDSNVRVVIWFDD